MRRQISAWGLVAPVVAGAAIFTVIPLGFVLSIAFTRWDLLGSPRYVGIATILSTITDPDVARASVVTALLVALVVPLQTASGLAIAIALERAGRAASVYRVCLLLPWIAAPVASAAVWRSALQPEGGLIAELLGRRSDALTDPASALLWVAGISIWSGAGYSSLFFTAALRAIPPSVVDAAMLDGASASQRLAHVVIPLLRPMIAFLLITGVASTATTFDIAYTLTGGGPDGATETIALRIYTEAFSSFDLGEAAVLSLGLLAVLFMLAIVQLRIVDREVAREP